MGETYRVVSRHRRSVDGDVEVFQAGDLIEPTDRELEAFPDKFERVEQTADGDWVPERQSIDDLGAPEAGEYRLTAPRHRRQEDGDTVVYERGDVVELTEQEAEAFGDKFERVTTAVDETDGEEDRDATDDVDEAEAEADDEDVEEAVDEAAEEDDAASSGGLEVPDDFEYDLPEDFPATLPDNYRALQGLATANGINGQQAKATLVEELEDVRDSEA